MTHKKLNPWSCMAASFANVLRMGEDDFYKVVGHDGSEIAHAGLPEPMCRRGHHVQECIDVCLDRGYTVTPIELFPVLQSQKSRYTVYFGPENDASNVERFNHYVKYCWGVITGMGQRSGHAVAVRGGNIIDPDNGEEYIYSQEACEARGFYPLCFWMVKP